MEGVVNELPLPIELPPLEAANQLIVPALAVALRFTVPAPHREAPELLATVGMAFTVAITSVRDGEAQVPLSVDTQYEVVVLIEGVLKLVPVPNADPPVDAANQLMVPALAAAERATTPVPQRELLFTELMVGEAFTDTLVVTVELHPGAETVTE